MAITAVSDLATIYGCNGLFDLCTDRDLMSLSFEGQNKFLDWIGWEKSDVCIIKKSFITYARPEGIENARSAGYITDPCGPSNGVEFGVCDFTLEDYALLRRHGPVRNATDVDMKYCEVQPRYRLDGSPIRDNDEFDMRLATEALLQDLKLMLFDGNKTTQGHFDGINRLIKTGYTNSAGRFCRSMDSIVIDWNDNTLAGGSGITWNGAAVGDGYDFIDVLMAAFRRVLDRIQMAPALATQQMRVGDIILVAPTHILRCILDQFTCWSVCPGATNIQVAIQSYEARKFRDALNGGMFGQGKIYIDGFEIPLASYDWGLTDVETGSSDVYLLTGSVGNVKLIHGQYKNMIPVQAAYPEGPFRYTDGGRLLTWLNNEQTCVQREIQMEARLLMWAPWSQVRFEDVMCTTPGGILSPDPWNSSFFPETSFSAATM